MKDPIKEREYLVEKIGCSFQESKPAAFAFLCRKVNVLEP